MTEEIFNGLKVVELANFISGPYCGQMMANLGAEVIKIEKPKVGDDSRSFGPFPNDTPHLERSGLFLCLNTNKLGMTLDVKTDRGREILLELLKKADIFIENNPPKLIDELRLGYETLKKINPRLIVTSITPFGQTGPLRDYKGEAINTAGMGGFSLTVGEPGRPPITAPLSLGHYQSGGIAAFATITALIARDKTERGQHIDVSELDTWAGAVTGQLISAYIFKGMKKTRSGYRTSGSVYPTVILPCKDGYVWLVAIMGYQWKRFLEIMGGGKIPDWYANDPRFKDRREMAIKYGEELDNRIIPWLMKHTKKEFFAIARENHLPFTPVQDIGEVMNEEQFKERPFFVDVDHPETGTLRYPGAPFRLSETPWKIKGHAPLLGQHNEEILSNYLGYSREEIEQLREDEII
ncbi:hypothetical protein DRN98_03835 [Methanosarcinales archaeon]|nr:MAG: hypothetical protein DRN98_03835 [Methanosarcinales archaeon]